MLIINTRELKVKTKKLWLLALGFLLLCSACGKIDALRAKQDARRSQILYQQAVKRYKSAILASSSRDALRLALGELYYKHGEFLLAIEQLKQSAHAQAKRLLAIAYFKAGDFTAALEVFGKNKFSDDEYLYCYGQALEKLNLYDQALEEYALIKGKDFLGMARQRIGLIDRGKEPPLAKNMDSRIFKMILNAPPAENYPQAGALILYCEEKVEVSAENTQVSSAHILVKIINERGKNSFSEASINYDSTYEKVELEFARTIKPDGTVVDVGARHIRDVSKYLNFPLYSNARVFIISFPEISEGACVEYKFKIYRHELVNKKDFVLNYSLFNSEPAIEAYFTVRIPKSRGLKINYLNTSYSDPGRELAPRIIEEQDSRIYYWVFKDIPQIIPEANMPPGAEINPTVLLSTFNSWQEIYQWWWGLAKDKIKPDAAIKAKVAELTKGLLEPEDKARAIYNFCSQKIRYVAVEYGKAGHQPHDAADVFRNKYGDCKDQAILLVTMFKEAGLKGWPVLIPTRGIYNLNIDFPSIFFDHCIGVLELKDKLIFLDPTAETTPFGDLPAGDQERRVIIFQEDGFKIHQTPLLPARHNLIQNKLKLKVAKDGSVVADKTVLASGVYEQGQRYWLLYTTPEGVSETLKQKIQEVSIGAVLDNYKIENLYDLNKPLSLSYNFHGPEYLMLAGPLEIMPQLAMVDPFLTAKDKRVYPLDFDFLDTKETFFEIELPRGVKVKYFPESFEAESKWMDFSVQYAVKGSTIYFYQKSQVKNTEVSKSEYPEFKKFFEEFARKIKQRVILEKKG